LLTLLGLGALIYELRGQTIIESPDDSPARMILEVINRHFTVGQKIPSVYLRVLSDRTATCHLLNSTGKDTGIVKEKTLTPEEFERLKAQLDRPDLRKVKRRYDLTHSVFDSWMEWDISVPHADRLQDITVADFSPSPTRGSSQPYPDALVMVGCSISMLRDEVCGDERDYRRSNCEKVLLGK
jgi:hypothetical protein